LVCTRPLRNLAQQRLNHPPKPVNCYRDLILSRPVVW
jgi:hypothetical protein